MKSGLLDLINHLLLIHLSTSNTVPTVMGRTQMTLWTRLALYCKDTLFKLARLGLVCVRLYSITHACKRNVLTTSWIKSPAGSQARLDLMMSKFLRVQRGSERTMRAVILVCKGHTKASVWSD